MANIDIVRGRSTVLSLTNRSGATRSPGDLAIVDTTNDESFTVSTSSNTKVPIGVVDETIGIGSNGRVVVEGYARAVKTLGTSNRGDYLFHSTTTATAAHMAGTEESSGSFGYVLDGGSGTATTAYIYPTTPTLGTTLAYGSNSNEVSYANAAGASTSISRADHVHRGVTSLAHASNTFTGPVTFTTPGNTVGITSPATGTYAFTATGGGGSGSTTFSGAKAYNSATQSINGTAALTFDSEEYDTDAYHDTASNTSRMTIPSGKDGTFRLTCSAKEGSGGMTDSYFQKNGATRLRSNTPYVGSGGGGTPYGTCVVSLVAGDYVEFFIVTGGATNFGSATTGEDQAIFTLERLGS